MKGCLKVEMAVFQQPATKLSAVSDRSEYNHQQQQLKADG
jgi:hypothetical protein